MDAPLTEKKDAMTVVSVLRSFTLFSYRAIKINLMQNDRQPGDFHSFLLPLTVVFFHYTEAANTDNDQQNDNEMGDSSVKALPPLVQ